MARFVGTVQDYHHFMGPRIRNVVNQAAAPARKAHNGICEHCGGSAELQSAHVHGRDRRTLIETVLGGYTRPDGYVDIDVDEVERQIIDAHMPFDETFKFICGPCHRAYDAGFTQRVRSRQRDSSSGQSKVVGGEFPKLGRIEMWAARPMQDNYRIIRAFLALEKSGDVYLSVLREYCERELGMVRFSGKYASLKSDAGNSYGRVFFDDGDIVRMWPEVRAEVDRYF